MSLNVGGIDLGISMPNFSTHGAGWWITVISIIAIFFIIIIGVIWFWYRSKVYKYKIILFENISGQGYQPTGRDRGRLLSVGEGGEEILYLMRRKLYRSAYGRKMGKNTFWFVIGQDGYWYNCVLGDLDAKMGMLDIEPIDRDMRYMHVAIRKNIQDRYRKVKFMEKYGTMLMGGIFLLIMIIAIWLLMSKAGDLITGAKPIADALIQSSTELKNAYSQIDTICSTSGISPAGA